MEEEEGRRANTFLSMKTSKQWQFQPAISVGGVGTAPCHDERGSTSLYLGSGGRAPDQRVRGRSPLKRSTFSFWTFNGSLKFAHFSKIWKRKKFRFCVIFARNRGWLRNWGAGAKLGVCALRPWPKTATAFRK